MPLLPPVQRALAVAPAAASGAPALQLAPRSAPSAEAAPLNAAAEDGPGAPADARAAQRLLAGLAGLTGPAGLALLTRAGARGLGPPPLLAGVLAAAAQAGDDGDEADGAAGAAARDADGDEVAAQARAGGAGAAASVPLLTGGPTAGPGRGAAPPPLWGAWRGAQASDLPSKLWPSMTCRPQHTLQTRCYYVLTPGRASSAAAGQLLGRSSVLAPACAWAAQAESRLRCIGVPRLFMVLSRPDARAQTQPLAQAATQCC